MTVGNTVAGTESHPDIIEHPLLKQHASPCAPWWPLQGDPVSWSPRSDAIASTVPS
jgi:hypothetical protein